MSNYIGTFRRVEYKYQLSALQRIMLESALAAHMEIDLYGRTLISSMYWDTENWDLVERSMDKPLYKEKLRLRRYGSHITIDNEPCFVELKKKYGGIVYKRRIRMTSLGASLMLLEKSYEEASLLFPLPSSDADYSASEVEKARTLQIAHEIEACRERWKPLSPSMIVECQRTAWQLPEGSPYAASQLRITFDDNLGYRELMDIKRRPRRNTPLIDASQSVLEIKAVGAMPRWLVDALEDASIKPASFTKYGRAYQDLMRKAG